MTEPCLLSRMAAHGRNQRSRVNSGFDERKEFLSSGGFRVSALSLWIYFPKFFEGIGARRDSDRPNIFLSSILFLVLYILFLWDSSTLALC